MGEVTKIEWCDHTFNPWIGCTKVAPECKNCYADELMAKRWKKVEWGDNGTRKLTSDANWKLPLKWNKAAEKEGVRRRVFCASLADVFEDRPELVYWRQELFSLIDNTPNLDWLLLTKRPENIRKMWPVEFDRPRSPEVLKRRDNVWLGTSVGHPDSEWRIKELLKVRHLSSVLFLSMEPLLGSVDLSKWLPPQQQLFVCQKCGEEFSSGESDGHGRHPYCGGQGDPNGSVGASEIDWVIVGGESGPHARPCGTEWIRSIRDQCRAAGVPVFVKQLGAKPTLNGDPINLKDSKGGNWDEWTEDLRVREFPEVRS